MELKDFVSGTIIQIIERVNSAIEYGNKHNARVNPDLRIVVHHLESITADEFSKNYVNIIDFDVAVTTGKEGEVKSGLGIFVGGIGVGAQATMDEASSTANRIRFSIPVMLPKS